MAFDRPSLDAALQTLEEMAKDRPLPKQVVRTHTSVYLVHLCYDGGSTTLCGEWIGKFNGGVNLSGQHEVVASPETLEYWYLQPNKFWLCPICEGHEDYPLFALGAV
jgi:hypothetical protein